MFKKIGAFIKNSYTEMVEHVTWPSYSSIQESAVLVIIASVIFSAVLGVFDLAFRNMMDAIYKLF